MFRHGDFGSRKFSASPWPATVVVAAAAFALYAMTMPRVVTFEDAGLFDSVCATNGIAHPPGYPLFTLMCVPLFHLPLEPALIGNAMSALFGAVSCGLLVLLSEALGLARMFAMFGGLLLAVSQSFWSQAIIVEVYTLNTLIFLTTLLLCVRFYQRPGRRLAYLVCFVYSLGIANHWPLMVLAFPGLALICFARFDWIKLQWADPKFWAIVALCVLAGIAPYASLLLHHPGISFSGPITSLSALWDYFMRKAYAGVDHQSGANITDKWHYLLWFFRQVPGEVTMFALPLAIPGLVLAWRRFGKAVSVALVLIFLANSVGLILLLGFEYNFTYQAIFRPYPLESWISLIVWIAAGMSWIAEWGARFTRYAMPAVAIICALLVGVTLRQNIVVNNRSGDTLAADYARTILTSLPMHANIVTASDADTFPLAYLRYVDHIRDDVSPYQIKNVVYPNRLPGKSFGDRTASILKMAAKEPTFGMFDVPGLPAGINYGEYQRYTPGRAASAAEKPILTRFRRRLIDDWLHHRITDKFERDFIMQSLINYTGQLLELRYQHRLSAADAKDLAALQKTFAGRYMTLAFADNHPDYDIGGRALLDLAFAAEAHIPPEANNLNRATFHYAFALLFLSGQRGIAVNVPLARELLLKSFQDLPSTQNPGLCLLQKMHPPKGHLSLTPRFVNACARRVMGKE